MGQPRPLYCLFLVFSNKQYKFHNKLLWTKCPSSIWHWDSNSQPSAYKSPPLTTRPGLPPRPAVALLPKFCRRRRHRNCVNKFCNRVQRKCLEESFSFGFAFAQLGSNLFGKNERKCILTNFLKIGVMKNRTREELEFPIIGCRRPTRFN